MKLKVGDSAPDFELPDADGKNHRLSDFTGKKILIYFYPRDNTPGCTKEACSFRDNVANFQKLKTEVIGISADSPNSHTKFALKYHLPFLLLSDPAKLTIKAYGALGPKKFMGKSYIGIYRISFLISEKGKIIKIYEKVNPVTHTQEVLTDLNN